VKYLSPEQVLFIHSRIIDTTGGSHGIRDIGLLQSSVSRPKATFDGKDLYPDVFRKAAALMESLARDHPFIDGNKRTAITSTAIFLGMNGYRLETTQKELERFTLSVAVGRVQFDDIAAWFNKFTLESPGS
jgi:death-on-curing protein